MTPRECEQKNGLRETINRIRVMSGSVWVIIGERPFLCLAMDPNRGQSVPLFERL